MFSSYTRLVDHHRIISYHFEISCHLTVKSPSFRNAKTIILIGGSSHLARYGYNEKNKPEVGGRLKMLRSWINPTGKFGICYLTNSKSLIENPPSTDIQRLHPGFSIGFQFRHGLVVHIYASFPRLLPSFIQLQTRKFSSHLNFGNGGQAQDHFQLSHGCFSIVQTQVLTTKKTMAAEPWLRVLDVHRCFFVK